MTTPQHKIDISNTPYGKQVKDLTFNMEDLSDLSYPSIVIVSHDRTQHVTINFSLDYNNRSDSLFLTGQNSLTPFTTTIEITETDLQNKIEPEYITSSVNIYELARGELIFKPYAKEVINCIGNNLTAQSLSADKNPTFFQGATLKGLGRIYNYQSKDKTTIALFNTLTYENNTFLLKNISTKLSDANELAFDFIPADKTELIIRGNALFKVVQVNDSRSVSINNQELLPAIQTGNNSSYIELAKMCGAMDYEEFYEKSQNYLAEFKSEENKKKEEEEIIKKLLF